MNIIFIYLFLPVKVTDLAKPKAKSSVTFMLQSLGEIKQLLPVICWVIKLSSFSD